MGLANKPTSIKTNPRAIEENIRPVSRLAVRSQCWHANKQVQLTKEIENSIFILTLKPVHINFKVTIKKNIF